MATPLEDLLILRDPPDSTQVYVISAGSSTQHPKKLVGFGYCLGDVYISARDECVISFVFGRTQGDTVE